MASIFHLITTPDACDALTARARISGLHEKNIAINQWIRILTTTDTATTAANISSSSTKRYLVYYAKAWPTSDTTDQPTIICEPLIKRAAMSVEIGLLSGILPDQCIIRQMPSKPVDAIQVRVSVTVKQPRLQLDELGFDFHKGSLEMQQSAVQNSLLNLAVSSKCRILAPTRALSIKILDTTPSNANVVVTVSTSIIIDSKKQATDLAHAFQNMAISASNADMDDEDEEDQDMLAVDLASVETVPGLEAAYKSLMDILIYPLYYRDIVQKMHVDPPKGVLVYGPPGVGKTMLVNLVAKACKAIVVTINGPEIFGSNQAESEQNLRNKFDQARDLCKQSQADAIAASRSNTSISSHVRGVTSSLLSELSSIESLSFVVVGATNRPESIDAALRRPGRFDREVAIDPPNEAARTSILALVAKKVPCDDTIDWTDLGKQTIGYVGADLEAVVREAAMDAVSKGQTHVNHLNMKHALSIHPPSMTRSLTVKFTATSWTDIGGLASVKKALQQAIEWPISRPQQFERLGAMIPRGVLLYGPPGCSKTTLVKALATSSGVTFLSINGASLYSPFVGDSEKAVRSLFTRARMAKPTIIFIDEIDAIVGKRNFDSNSSESHVGVRERVLATLLSEMDGVESAKGVIVVAATNRPDMIDTALMRPGRFDRVIYVPPPDTESRLDILRIHTRKMPLDESIDLAVLAEGTRYYTGADLEALCREAALDGVRGDKDCQLLNRHHFDSALRAVRPSLSAGIELQFATFQTPSSAIPRSVSRSSAVSRASSVKSAASFKSTASSSSLLSEGVREVQSTKLAKFCSAASGRERLVGKSAPPSAVRDSRTEPLGGKSHSTAFGTVYVRGGIPCRLQHGSVQHRISWTAPPSGLSFSALCPLFITGLLETHPQYRFMAHQGLVELVSSAPGAIQLGFPSCIAPLRAVLSNGADKGASLVALRVLGIMVERLSPDTLASSCGMLLPPISRLAVSKDRELNDATHSMLRTWEESGGPQVLKLIKARIPTYTSIRSC
ncbi:hypothetical protein SmJEL517_g02465 [Synchytrium microbalum]|uniref:AAA+ ATPase domain-containing protein n=1 Tax=Synchytrium microbalum TaxID=1806994 RepID=A0A507C5U3_9FUNG|nr:uncharacterized protein SmJEL517_g02465 [Synchytrium microbalum]TPX35012.1 hypothetical protein SmJEL517_g02465 [Synchytrium microbalum]